MPANGDDGSHGTMWIGQVAFGIVQYDTVRADGSHMVLKLQAHAYGH
jgi:hypothetical protein